ERTIADPRHVYLLSLKVSGIADQARVLSEGRQRAISNPAAPSAGAVYHVEAAFPPDHGAPVVTRPGDDPTLQDEPLLMINDPAIRKQAKEIAGSETDRAVIARKIHDWVNTWIIDPVSTGFRRSAPEIMAHGGGAFR